MLLKNIINNTIFHMLFRLVSSFFLFCLYFNIALMWSSSDNYLRLSLRDVFESEQMIVSGRTIKKLYIRLKNASAKWPVKNNKHDDISSNRINTETNTKYSGSIMYKIGFSYNLLFQPLHLHKSAIPPLKSKQICFLIFFYFIFFYIFYFVQCRILCCAYLCLYLQKYFLNQPYLISHVSLVIFILFFNKFMNIWKDNSIETKTQQIYFCNACYSVFLS